MLLKQSQWLCDTNHIFTRVIGHYIKESLCVKISKAKDMVQKEKKVLDKTKTHGLMHYAPNNDHRPVWKCNILPCDSAARCHCTGLYCTIWLPKICCFLLETYFPKELMMIQLTTARLTVAGVVGLIGAATYAVIFYPMSRAEEYSKPFCPPNLLLCCSQL